MGILKFLVKIIIQKKMINYFEIVLILIIIALGVWVWKLYLEKREAEKEVVALEKAN